MTSSIGTITGIATAAATGASGNASAASTATGSGNTVIADATAPTSVAGVSAKTAANVAGSWFGNPIAGSNGYATYADSMGSPTQAVQTQILTSNVDASLTASKSSVFGAGELGANYSSSSKGTVTYTASNTYDFALTGTNKYTLGLLNIAAYGSGFQSLSFTVTDGSTTLLTKSFTSLTSAKTYFTDDPVSLGSLSGKANLTVSYKLTADAAEGTGITYVVGDAPQTTGAVGAATGGGAASQEAAPHLAPRTVNLASALPTPKARLAIQGGGDIGGNFAGGGGNFALPGITRQPTLFAGSTFSGAMPAGLTNNLRFAPAVSDFREASEDIPSAPIFFRNDLGLTSGSDSRAFSDATWMRANLGNTQFRAFSAGPDAGGMFRSSVGLEVGRGARTQTMFRNSPGAPRVRSDASGVRSRAVVGGLSWSWSLSHLLSRPKPELGVY